MLGATTCSGWNDDPSDRCTNEMPAFESRRVRTQPLTVTSASFAASPARIARTLNSLLSMERSDRSQVTLSSQDSDDNQRARVQPMPHFICTTSAEGAALVQRRVRDDERQNWHAGTWTAGNR